MVGWYHRLNRHEFEQAPGDSEGQGNLACCSPWGHKESDTTEATQQQHQQYKNLRFSMYLNRLFQLHSKSKFLYHKSFHMQYLLFVTYFNILCFAPFTHVCLEILLIYSCLIRSVMSKIKYLQDFSIYICCNLFVSGFYQDQRKYSK